MTKRVGMIGDEPLKKGLGININVDTDYVTVYGNGKVLLEGSGPYERWIAQILFNKVINRPLVEEDTNKDTIEVKNEFFSHTEIKDIIIYTLILHFIHILIVQKFYRYLHLLYRNLQRLYRIYRDFTDFVSYWTGTVKLGNCELLFHLLRLLK